MSTSILTIVTPAATHDLTTIENLKDELGITDNVQDNRLYRWISEASGFIESYCDRIFAEEVLSEQWRNIWWPESITLRRRPVSAIGSVTVDGVALTTDQWEADLEAGLVYRLSGDSPISLCGRKIVIVYTAGYALLDGLPYGIESTCIEIIKHRQAARARDPNLRMQEIPGELVQQWWVPGANEDGIPPSIKASLDPHRKISV